MDDETVFDPAALDEAALLAEFNRVRDRGTALRDQETLSAEETAELTELASRATALQSEFSAREARAAELSAAKDVFASLPERSAPAVEPTSVQTSQETVATPVAPQTAVQPVSVPSVGDMANKPIVPVADAERGVGEFGVKPTVVTAFVSSDAAGHVGKQSGEAFEGIHDVSKALIASSKQFGKGSRGQSRTLAIAQFQRERDPRLVADRHNEAEVLAFARDEKRLPGGNLARAWQRSLDAGTSSLTAAAGWCAPSENDYDLCRQWSAGVGILDLPSITATRGGINYTDDVTFQTIYANAVAVGGGSNFLTEAEVIADTAKTCSDIPCPEFEDRRLDVLALCIRVSFLQAAAFPEVVSTWTDGLLAANEQEMNRLIIADVIARAGAATVIDPAAGAQRDSWTSGLLAAVELAAEDIRYQFMMAWDATVEIVLPHWVLPQIRADLSRRNGVNLLAVSDAEIASMFSVRNVRVQFVRGWQDGLITGGALNAAFPGGDIATPFLTALPNDVSFLAYPAGSVVVARQDVVTLTNVYDAASLATNEFTGLFAEEGFAPLYPCAGQRLYTVNELCNMGPTGANALNCAVAV